MLSILANSRFRRLFAAHAISLIGDSLTWVGIALLAFQLAGTASPMVLGVALMLRVAAYVGVAPWAGVAADRYDRRAIMVAADIGRALVVLGLVFATDTWHLYALMFVLNVLTALFRPAFDAALPEVAGPDDTPRAISLAGAVSEVLGVLGPGVAGGLVALVGVRSLFAVDAATFIISALLLVGLRLRPRISVGSEILWPRDVRVGTRFLWGDPDLRHAVLLELVVAIAGAMVLVDSVGYVRGLLGLSEADYGWTMVAFGGGAAVAALAVGSTRIALRHWMLAGATVAGVSLIPASAGSWALLLVLWFFAGAGQNLVALPAQMLVARQTTDEERGRVYGAHFAWSHLWWLIAYPLAAWLGEIALPEAFLFGGSIALVGLVAVQATAHFASPPQFEVKTGP